MQTVQKADGTTENFDKQKVLISMQRAGIPKALEGKVLSHINDRYYPGIQTWEIYHHINEFLSKSSHPYSRARYSLKQAIMMLGPTGYPFEDFVSAVMQADGYKTEVRQILNGKCVTHEVDVLAEKSGKRIMIEAKFHNNPGNRSDIHVALYTKARFDDAQIKNNLSEGWLVTNTKATVDAIAYAACENLKIVSWGYPIGESLRELVEKYTLYPITMLTTLTISQKAQLLQHHVILCKEICAQPDLLRIISLSHDEKKRTMEEVHYICQEEHAADQPHIKPHIALAS